MLNECLLIWQFIATEQGDRPSNCQALFETELRRLPDTSATADTSEE